MTDLSIFETIAEVSITFTGLAGIVSVLGRSTLDRGSRHWRVWNMILLSLLSFFLCLLPLALNIYELPVATLWAVSSMALLTAQICQIYFANRMGKKFGPASSLMIRPLVVLYFAGSIAVGLLQVLNIVLLTPGPGPFFLGICWLMFLASLHFFVLVINTDLKADDTRT